MSDAPELKQSKRIILLVWDKRRGVAVPAYKGDLEALQRFKDRGLIMAQSHTPPSAKQRAFYWALLGKIVQNHEFYYDAEQLNDVIKHALNYYDLRTDHNMNPIKVLRSNARLERNHEEYKEFCNRAFDFIVHHILSGVTKKELIREVEKDFGLMWRDAERGNRGEDRNLPYDE